MFGVFVMYEKTFEARMYNKMVLKLDLEAKCHSFPQCKKLNIVLRLH